jgi:glucose/arabinose dehydrogenase
MRIALLLVCLCACGSAPLDPNCQLIEGEAGPVGGVRIDVETVVTGLEVPWGIAFLPDGAMLVTERPGRIRLVRGSTIERTVADVPIASDGEGGLLGITLAPDFDSSRAFFVYFTAEGGVNRVERWILSADSQTASRDRTILDGIPASVFHDGGRLRIGPDGMLYIGTGDARDPDLAQDRASLAGKILRIAPDGSVPADNPEAGSSMFILGIRNTQGFDWIDERTLVVSDHGPSGELGREGHDELTLARPGDNLGWPTIYGCESGEGQISPLISWVDAVPPGGAAIYRGTAISEWQGNVLIGSLGATHLHRVVLEAGRVASHEVYLTNAGRLREVIMGPDGELYVTTSNCDGRGDCPADKDRILRVTRR